MSASVTIPSGVASATYYYGDETAGTPTIHAYDPITSQAFGSVLLTMNPTAPTKLVYAPTPTSTPTAGAPFIVNVAEVDQFGNSITTDNTTAVTLSASNGASQERWL